MKEHLPRFDRRTALFIFAGTAASYACKASSPLGLLERMGRSTPRNTLQHGDASLKPTRESILEYSSFFSFEDTHPHVDVMVHPDLFEQSLEALDIDVAPTHPPKVLFTEEKELTIDDNGNYMAFSVDLNTSNIFVAGQGLIDFLITKTSNPTDYDLGRLASFTIMDSLIYYMALKRDISPQEAQGYIDKSFRYYSGATGEIPKHFITIKYHNWGRNDPLAKGFDNISRISQLS